MIWIMQLINVEGLSKPKAYVLVKMLREEKIDLLTVQENHNLAVDLLLKRSTINGYNTSDEIDLNTDLLPILKPI